MKLNRIAKLSIIAILAVFVMAATAYTQSGRTFVASLSNVCSQQSVFVQNISMTAGNSTLTAMANFTMTPGFTINATFPFPNPGGGVPDPSLVEVTGVFNNEDFSALFRGIVLGQSQTNTSAAGGCLQLIVTEQQDDDDDGTPTPQPTDPDSKPITGGESLEQTLNTLTANGFQVTQDGSESSPKLSNVNDPILLRGINAFSAQVVWVSAPGLLRTVITWDNPTTDLDLLVFGISACFQLNPAGFLAELCDRAPQGPVTGAVFAVVVINWSASSQQYTMSLST